MPTAMSTFDSSKEGLQDLLNDIRDGKIQLPDFQRDWRWDDDHIQSLLASVSLSYPIGAVLLMETGGGGTHFAPRSIAGVQLSNSPVPQRLILDGQQRLTALYQVLRSNQTVTTRDSKGKTINRWYYLDIEKALDPNTDREEAIVSLPADRKILNFRGEVIKDYSDMDKECAAGLFPLSLIYDISRLFQWLDHYTNSSDSLVQQQRRDLRDQLTAEVISRIQQYQVPVIELRRETPKEAVCQVFEKVNTGGVSLNVFELVTATFAADNYRLRDDWSNREKQLKAIPVLSNISSSDFLTAVTLLSTWEKQQQDSQTTVSCKRRDILNLKLADYQRVADRLTQSFKDAARFLVRQKIYTGRDIPYQTQIIPLASILTALGLEAENDSVKQLLARWYWCGVLGELYGSAVETKFAKDLPEVMAWVKGGPEPTTVHDSSFAPQRLLGLRTRNSAAYKGLHALLMREGCQDFRTGDSIDLQMYFDEKIDLHHIFPRKVCQNWGLSNQRYDSVINKTPLSARTNRMIGGNHPNIYLDRLQRNGSIPEIRMNEILQSHLIDPASLRANQFESFFQRRENALLSLIEKATGKTILRAETIKAEVYQEDTTAEEELNLDDITTDWVDLESASLAS